MEVNHSTQSSTGSQSLVGSPLLLLGPPPVKPSKLRLRWRRIEGVPSLESQAPGANPQCQQQQPR